MKWRKQDIPGALAAWAVSLCALLVIVNPVPALRAGLALMTPLVVLLAFLGSLQSGSCPSCRASSRRQVRSAGDPVVSAASRTSTAGDGVSVLTGWEVQFPVVTRCSRCDDSRRVVSSRFVPLTQAATETEAVLIARRDASSVPF